MYVNTYHISTLRILFSHQQMCVKQHILWQHPCVLIRNIGGMVTRATSILADGTVVLFTYIHTREMKRQAARFLSGIKIFDIIVRDGMSSSWQDFLFESFIECCFQFV